MFKFNEAGKFMKKRIHDGKRFRTHFVAECDVCHDLFYPRVDNWKNRLKRTGEVGFTCNLCTLMSEEIE